MAHKLPLEVSDTKSLKIMHDQAEDFLRKNTESETLSCLPSNLESNQQNATNTLASNGDTSKPLEHKLEESVDDAGTEPSQDGGNVQQGSNGSIKGVAMPPQGLEYGSGSPNPSRPRREGEIAETIEQFTPGVYVTLIVRPGGIKIFKRVRFSKQRFDKQQAEEWWSKNKDKVLRKYSPSATNFAAKGPPSTPSPPVEENLKASTS